MYVLVVLFIRLLMVSLVNFSCVWGTASCFSHYALSVVMDCPPSEPVSQTLPLKFLLGRYLVTETIKVTKTSLKQNQTTEGQKQTKLKTKY